MKRRVVLFHIEGEEEPVSVCLPLTDRGLPPPIREPKPGDAMYTPTGSYRVISLQEHHSVAAWYVNGERIKGVTVHSMRMSEADKDEFLAKVDQLIDRAKS